MSTTWSISDEDWITNSHLRLHGPATRDACYATLQAVTPYLESQEWRNSASGHYLNVITKSRGPALRVGYFTPTENVAVHARTLLGAAIQQIGVAQVRYDQTRQEVFTETYGGSESHFRAYLAAYSQIVVDLIRDKGVLHTRRLFALFRLRVVASGLSRQEFLEPVVRDTPTYSAFDQAERDAFWKAIDFVEDPLNPWVHFIVNLGIGIDWGYQPEQSWDLEFINQRLTQLGFTIPPGWQP